MIIKYMRNKQINATELRIGNWIASGEKFNDTSTIGKVLEIGNEERDFEQIYCECLESFEWFFKDNYCGIPLTEELLLKCGFEKKDKEWYLFPSPEIQIIVLNDDKYNGVMFYTRTIHTDYTPIYCTKHINNVHQLQNLYFALTGQELEINI